MMTLEQQRAKYAWESVKGKGKAFKSLAKGAPALIMSNGLMPSLAFWWAKKEDKQSVGKELVNIILGWLSGRKIVSSPDFLKAMEDLQIADPAKFRNATEETLDFLKWLRNFASAVCKD